MAATILNGRALAEEQLESLKKSLQKESTSPHLAVLLVGDDPASSIYVRYKKRACDRVGVQSTILKLAKDATAEQCTKIIDQLNQDAGVHGILVQLPLPGHLPSDAIIGRIRPEKDVDGLTPTCQGRLVLGQETMVPCTPKGILALLKSYAIPLVGREAVVVGRSRLVGSPMATLLLRENMTVTTVHSKSLNPAEVCRRADVLIVACGQRHLVDQQWVKPGCAVIDVGIHRMNGLVVGDVHFDRVKENAGYVSPVPGGVGPLTISSLLSNCYQAYKNLRES